jgi:hypothetical protein
MALHAKARQPIQGQSMRTVRKEYFLTIREIAEEYVRNGREVRQALFNAFWMGSFEPFVREGLTNYPLMSRRAMLKAWHELGDHPGLHFATSPEEEAKEHPEGSIDVDLRTRIVLPAQAVDWKPRDFKAAYRQLANVSMSDISRYAKDGLMCQFLGAYELLAACYELGEPPPVFWEHWDTTRRPSQHKKSEFFQGQAESANWLHQRLLGAKASEVLQQDVRAEAQSDHGLGEEVFSKLWDAIAPDNLKKGGRRLGSKNR